MIFSIGFRFRGRHEPDASHPRFSHSVVFLRLCVSPRSLGAVTPLIRVSSIRAFRCMANDWKTCNCIKSFISPRAKRERTTGFSSSSSAKKRGRRSIMSSSSSSFRPLKMMCVLFLSSLSVSLATHEAFQLFLKRTRVGNILRPSVALKRSLSERKQRGASFEIIAKKSTCSLRTLSSSNFVAHDALFLLTQYIRRPVRVDDAKT